VAESPNKHWSPPRVITFWNPDVQNEFYLAGKITIFNDLYFVNEFSFCDFCLLFIHAPNKILRTVTAVLHFI